MKSIYLLYSLLAMLISSTALSQVVILDQNFESGSLPAGWTRDQSSPSKGWEFGTSSTLGSGYFSPPAHTKYTASNDDKHDNQATTQNLADRDMLITPTLNLTTLSTGVLSFSVYHTGAYGSVATIEISTDGGTNWSVMQTVAGAATWQDLTIDLSTYINQSNVKFAFVHNDGGDWADGVAIDDVKVFQPTPNDVRLVSIDMPAATSIGSVPVEITVKNVGTGVLNSFVFNWTSDGGTTINSDPVNGLSLAPGATTTITHNNSLTSLSGGMYDVDVELLLPNGQLDQTNNNTGLKNVSFAVGVVDKFVLVEEFTGAWCQFCPDGASTLAAILAANDDVIGVAIHEGDAMEFNDVSALTDAFVGGFPAGMVDRYLFDGASEVATSSRQAWPPQVVERQATTSLGIIEASNTYDVNSRLLTVDVTATFLANLSGDYRVNVYIVEDSVTGTGAGYNQKNAYNNVSGHPYYQAGNPIQNYYHRDVVRYFMGGAWGKAGVITNPIAELTPYNTTFSYTLPAAWNANKVHLVAVIQKYGASPNDREIINALELELNSSEENDATIVENVATVDLTSITHSVCGGGKEGSIFVDANGCTDCNFTWSNGGTGNVAYDLSPGTYTVTMENNSGISVTDSYTIYGPIMLNPTVVINNGSGSVTLDIKGGIAPYTVSWSNGSSDANQTDLATGLYEVTVIDNGGCSTVQNLRVGYAVGINNVANSINFDVYPNPTNGIVSVKAELSNRTNVTIQVFNTLGALVSETSLSGLAQVREVIDLSGEANGVYIVKVTADGTSGVRRLVLNH